MPKWQWIYKQISSRLWLRAAMFCLLGVCSALLSSYIGRYLPEGLQYKIGAKSIETILHILASSMMAATTFSLSVMVSSYAAVTNTATPRATKLLLADRTSQNALSAFIGTFLYSLFGIIALQAGVYNDNGLIILFVMTLVVIFIVVATLLRWIDYLSKLGRVGYTIDMVEKEAGNAIDSYLKKPYLGGVPVRDQDWSGKELGEVILDEIGFIQYIDVADLERIADENELNIRLHLRPGHYSDGLRPAVTMSFCPHEKLIKRIRKCFSVGGERSFDQDPKYGCLVLSEIAVRALSPGINDPGTAIDVIGTQYRLFTKLARKHEKPQLENIEFPHIQVVELPVKDFFYDAFKPIARDGAGQIEVMIALQKALGSIGKLEDKALYHNAQEMSHYALKLARQSLTLEEDVQLLEALTKRFTE